MQQTPTYENLRHRVARAGKLADAGLSFSEICRQFRQSPPTVANYLLSHYLGDRFDWDEARRQYVAAKDFTESPAP